MVRRSAGLRRMGSPTAALSALFEGIGRKVGRMGQVHGKAVRVGVPLDVIRLPSYGDRSSRDGGWLDPARGIGVVRDSRAGMGLVVDPFDCSGGGGGFVSC